MRLSTHRQLMKYLEEYDVFECGVNSEGYLVIRIEDALYFDGVVKLPEKIIFYNEGPIEFDSLVKLPKYCEFRNFEDGDIEFLVLIDLPKETVFENSGDIYFFGLRRIPGGITFNNGGDVKFTCGIDSVGSNVLFSNSGDLLMTSVRTLNKSFEIRNEGSVYIYLINRLGNNFKFRNSDDVEITVESMGFSVGFYNGGLTRIKGISILPKRTKIWSSSVALDDVIKIDSRNPFLDCEFLDAPRLTGFLGGVSFHVEREIRLAKVDYLPRDVKVQNGGRNIIVVSGGCFGDNIIYVYAKKLSKTVRAKMKKEGIGDW